MDDTLREAIANHESYRALEQSGEVDTVKADEEWKKLCDKLLE